MSALVIPTTVIGGYLGAGKTTLVNHLLRHADGRRLAVLVNDFGALPIDADLIESVAGDVIGIAGGCVCCSYGSDLMAALESLCMREQRPDQLLIETSGVALPGAVAAAVSLVAGFRVDGVLVLADAETVRARTADRYMGDTLRRQFDDADLIVLNKLDLVTRAEAGALRRWLADVAGRRPVFECTAGRLPPVVVFGPSNYATQPADAARPNGAPRATTFGQGAGRLHDAAAHDKRFTAVTVTLDHPVHIATLARSIIGLRPAPLRAKGILTDSAGVSVQLHVVGARWQVHSAPDPAPGAGSLVVIGLAGELPANTVQALVERARVRGPVRTA